MRALPIAIAMLICLLSGCGSTKPFPNPNWREELDASNKKPRLIVQVCLATDTEVEIIGFSTLNRGAIRSMDSTSVKKTGTTYTGQPVFETYSDFPEEPIVNLVRIKGKEMQFAFSPETIAPRQDWSDWLGPLFASEDQELFWRILHEKSYTKVPYTKDGPKVRYILMSFNDYLQRVSLRRNGQLSESIPPC